MPSHRPPRTCRQSGCHMHVSRCALEGTGTLSRSRGSRRGAQTARQDTAGRSRVWRHTLPLSQPCPSPSFSSATRRLPNPGRGRGLRDEPGDNGPRRGERQPPHTHSPEGNTTLCVRSLSAVGRTAQASGKGTLKIHPRPSGHCPGDANGLKAWFHLHAEV